jgi:hypothetical protein
MERLHKFRLAAAAVLICAIFLPLSECSRRDNPPPPAPRSFSHTLLPQSDADFSYQYGFRALGFSAAGILTIIAFVWPFAFTIFGDKRRGPRLRWVLLSAELLLCAGTAYWVHAIMLGGRWLYGAYVVLAAILAFACSGVLLALARGKNNAL